MSKEEAWSSSGSGQPGTYYPSTQYTYGAPQGGVGYNPNGPVDGGYNIATASGQPVAGGVGMAPSAPQPPPAYDNITPNPNVEAGQPIPIPAPSKNEIALAFSEQSIRAAFIRKVFALVTCMMLIVVAECAVAMFVPEVTDFVQSDAGLITMGVMCAIFLVVYFAIICVPTLRRNFPVNIIMAFIMAATLGYLVAMLCSFFTVDSILLCVGLLVVSCASIGIFSCQTRFDMRNCIGIVILLSMYLFWIAIFSCGYMFWWPGAYWLNMLYSVIACILFMLYLAIDIQLIMGGGRMALSPEEYVFAAVQLFIDVVYIFIFLLQIFGVAKK